MTPPRFFVIPVVLLTLYAVITRARMDASSYLEISVFVVAWALASTLIVTLGSLLVTGQGNLRLAILGSAAAGALAFGVLAAFTIGLPFLLIGVALLYALFVALRGRNDPRARAAALGGAVMAIGALGLLLVTFQPVRVWCGQAGGGTSSGGFFAPQARSSGGSSTADSRQSGYIEEETRRAIYRCEDGRLIDFHYE